MLDFCDYCSDDILTNILNLIEKFTANKNEVVIIKEKWNNEIDTFNKYRQFAIDALKEAKTKVGDKKMSDKFDNLFKFIEDVIKYFQDGLQSKLTVKSGGTMIILKKI